MTGPIELLKERLAEIKMMRFKLMSKKEKQEITHLYNQYYACINILEKGINLKDYTKRNKKNDTER